MFYLRIATTYSSFSVHQSNPLSRGRLQQVTSLCLFPLSSFLTDSPTYSDGASLFCVAQAENQLLTFYHLNTGRPFIQQSSKL